ncbi:MAG: hypothetical protein K0R80_1044 [Clostridia bacterium]|nr:hypothetical protein [Clostridia bacterium]
MNIKDELLFWTSIMKDHANFQVDAFAPKEEVYIENSTYYMNFFSQIHEEIEGSDNLNQIYPKLLHSLRCFIDYKRTILKNQLTCSIAINLPPTAINHQINEANQFLMVFSSPAPEHMDKNMRTMLFSEQLKLWAADSAGHAALMTSFLEPVEGTYIQQALNFKMSFEKLTIKASELQMMLMYTDLENGTLMQLGQEEIEYMTDFIRFCEKIKELRQACKVMAQGTFTPLVPDHFIREHMHWIMKIKEYQ